MPVELSERYIVQAAIGAGAFGMVEKAHDLLLDRIVALKKIRSDQPADREKILREARTLAQINHPNIVTLHEVFEDGDRTVLVTEFIEGEKLTDHIHEAGSSFEETVQLAVKLAGGLKVVHDKGIVHADIKPDNIMITNTGEPVLVDFGVARIASTADEQQTICDDAGAINIEGTLAYMAPEVVRGDQPTPHSDIYSLGTVLYEMLSGSSAFKGKTRAATAHSVLTGKPRRLNELRQDVPKAFADLISGMMAQDVFSRPADMATVIRALREFDLQRSRELRRNWVRGGIAGAGLAGLVALAYWATIVFAPPPPPISSLIDSGLAELKAPNAKGAVERATNDFQAVLARDPENAAAMAGLSLSLTFKHDLQDRDPSLLQQARQLGQVASKTDGELSLGHVALAWAAQFEGKDSEAETHYQAALRKNPTDYFAALGYGRLLASSNRAPEAIAVLEDGIEHHGNAPLLLDELGAIYYQEQQFEAAQDMFERSLRIAPDNVSGYAYLSAVHYVRDDIGTAIGVLQRGLRIAPDPVLYSNLGTYYFALAQYEQSIEAFERAVRLKGSSQDYRLWANLADAYRAADGYEEQSRAAYRQALSALQPLLETGSVVPVRYSRAALYHAKAGEFDAARQRLAEALAFDGKDASLLFRAAVTSELIDERENALTYIEQALAHDYPLSVIRQEPELADMRTDGRYLQIVLNHTSKSGGREQP